jgi:signal transduction histidine kinase
MMRSRQTPRLSWASAFRRSRQRARIAFSLIVVFLVAQLVWWLVFQRNSIEDSMIRTTVAWARDARMAQNLLEIAPSAQRPALRQKLRLEYPHLNLDANPVLVNASVARAYYDRQTGFLRMFTYEGPFFILVILGGLYVVALSLRSDQELRRRQQNFLMAATHEFRTPITTLRLLIETAQYRELPREKQLDYLGRMELELRRLQDVSERVLATARLEQGAGSNDREVRDLGRVVIELIEAQRPMLEARGARISLEAWDVPLPVAVDAAAFSIVLGNLLDNAVKYSTDPEKPILVKLGTRSGAAFVSVEDRGIGISPREVPQIFDQFYRVGNELTRDARGLGLGLYLVKSITELLGGRVHCEPLKHGTRFTVSLPMVARERATLEPAPRTT